jgi:hypothetical protein
VATAQAELSSEIISVSEFSVARTSASNQMTPAPENPRTNTRIILLCCALSLNNGHDDGITT